MRSSNLAKLCRVVVPFLASLAVLSCTLPAQNLEQLDVGPPPMHRAEPPSPGASAMELEKRGDELQSAKYYLDAIDYYQAALKKDPNNPVLTNKLGMQDLMLHRWRNARRNFEQAIRLDKHWT